MKPHGAVFVCEPEPGCRRARSAAKEATEGTDRLTTRSRQGTDRGRLVTISLSTMNLDEGSLLVSGSTTGPGESLDHEVDPLGRPLRLRRGEFGDERLERNHGHRAAGGSQHQRQDLPPSAKGTDLCVWRRVAACSLRGLRGLLRWEPPQTKVGWTAGGHISARTVHLRHLL